MIRIHLRGGRCRNTFLQDISQDILVKEVIGKPLNSGKLPSIANKMFVINNDDEKFMTLQKRYNVPENCPNITVPKCNAEIWKNILTSLL